MARAILFLLVFLSLNSVRADTVPQSLSLSAAVSGIALNVQPDGSYAIHLRDPQWVFAGTTGHRLQSLQSTSGKDPVGDYQEARFAYEAQGPRQAAIRIYETAPIVLFSSRYTGAAANTDPFPVLTRYPSLAYHLSYDGVFGQYQFQNLGADGPWIFFDAEDAAFLLSPASHFLTAELVRDAKGGLGSGIAKEITAIPAGFEQRTALTFGRGINRVFETWGKALTDWQGKRRPSNDADVGLAGIGYWTDNGASYYYLTEPGHNYADTLLEAVQAFQRAGVRPGYLQLDSWWYPKGHLARWDSTDNPDRGGFYRLEAAADLFPQGLAAFQRTIQLPLVTHSRWIDPASPYRSEYAVSGNVAVDPAFWRDRMHYLKSSGVITYEQDWLIGPAVATRNLTDPEAFMDEMAGAAASEGMSLQYCMPLPRHYLQGTRYANLYTIRTSVDHFTRARWDSFLYASRLASSLGEWPWADVFESKEQRNLLIATLSGGMVGVGDRARDLQPGNLQWAARPDGVLVKPDATLVPLDATYLADARPGGLAGTAFVASTYTDHTFGRAVYLFAYARSGTGTARLDVSPRDLGFTGEIYAYDFSARTGVRMAATDRLSHSVDEQGAYYVLVPIGPSGIALVGDTAKYVTLGKKRIAAVEDQGTLRVSLRFAPGEAAVALFLDSESRPTATARSGRITGLRYDETVRGWWLSVAPVAGATDAQIAISSR